MIAVHPSRVSSHFRESWHPFRTHLLCHSEVTFHDIFLFLGLNEGAKRVCRTISIPDPVVGIEGMSVILVHLTVESREVTSVLAQADGALEGTIIRGIEHSFLVFGAAFDANVAERLVPFLATILDDFGHVEVLALLANEVLLRLFLADEGNAVTELNLLCTGRKA